MISLMKSKKTIYLSLDHSRIRSLVLLLLTKRLSGFLIQSPRLDISNLLISLKR